MYIVIEGQDGTGKSTQVRLLKKYFDKQGKKVVIMDEPDGDLPQAHDIHDLIVIRGRDYNLEPMTNFMLFTAARLELWKKLAEPTLNSGGIVISARNWWSSLAYQGYGEGLSRSKIIRLTKDIMPERYFAPSKSAILTVSDGIRLERQHDRGKATETFEAKPDAFQQRVNSAYPKIAKDFDIPIIDASGTINEVFDRLINSLNLQ
ncbi:dTMP kinase [Candidatus Saccharibacteria bacterium]|nr:dTMP kinase [Candidatus Saccharibacteria bacterium]